MSDTLLRENAPLRVVLTAQPRMLGTASIVVAMVALVGAFVPAVTVPAGLLALAGLVLGLSCLIRDPGVNRLAVGGSALSSAALSSAFIMTIVYAVI